MSIAAFGGLVFRGGIKKGTPVSNYSAKFAIDTEKQEQQSGKPATLIKGAQLAAISFAVYLNRMLGVDLDDIIAQAQALCEAGVPYPLIIGNSPISTNRFLLTSVSVSDALLDGKGRILTAQLELSFEEFVKEGTQTAATSGSSTISASPGVSSISATDAYKVTTVSSDDKASLKREFVSMTGE